MNAPFVLMFNLNNPKGARLRMICLKLHFRFRVVDPSEFGLTLEEIIEASSVNAKSEAAPSFNEEMLVFVNFGQKHLNALLNEMRASKLFVSLKAVLTDSNRKWTAEALCKAVGEEHAAMTKGEGHSH